eukprot:CAMPEP_0113696026 /NCGR_PEP_ID=MMETSP0038_2-20120614/21243_1 /TAXON_ID=2898 /ORGANISM="Cryptomonas paramecium" /LENGTH=176 /DNA_ID=CAMNT_0000618667 /DNA_START=35 /DNA_END=562 /DNA_ORIENTATION=- /assembly_acc=CAM_ASM_000170
MPLASAPATTRSVGSFQGKKLFGNVVEAWEKREISKVLENRNPAHFEEFHVGDTIAVRTINPYTPNKMMTFAGICIAIRNGLLGKAFIVRNHVEGVGVEQQFAFYSPLLKGVQVVRRPAKRIRQRKLYHLRDAPPKATAVSVSEAELTRLPKQVDAPPVKPPARPRRQAAHAFRPP